MRATAFFSAAAIVALIATGASAHHSAAMFDRTKTVTLAGTVKAFQWTNPHSWLTVSVPDASGRTVDWSIEMTSPNLLARAGWRPSTLKPGEKITVLAAPLHDGTPGAQFRSATAADGRVLNNNTVNAAAAPAAAQP